MGNPYRGYDKPTLTARREIVRMRQRQAQEVIDQTMRELRFIDAELEPGKRFASAGSMKSGRPDTAANFDEHLFAGPWTTNTVEAEPSSLVGVLLARTEQLEQSRAWTVALEQRIEEIRQEAQAWADCGEHSVERVGSYLLDLIDAELVAE